MVQVEAALVSNEFIMQHIPSVPVDLPQYICADTYANSEQLTRVLQTKLQILSVGPF